MRRAQSVNSLMTTEATIRNWEIVMLALQVEGAQSRRVHTEDVALRCFRLAPDAFSWLKHPEYPDKEPVRKDLTRLRDGQYGEQFVRGRAGLTKKDEGGTASTDGWQLTDAGVEWLLANQGRLHHEIGARPARTNRQDDLKSLQRVRKHPLYTRYEENPNSFAPALGELAEMLRCRVDSDERIWSSRFASLRNQARLAGQTSLLAFLERCETIRPSLR